MRSQSNSHLSADFDAYLVDADSGGLTLLMMDLQAAITYLCKRDAFGDAITFANVLGHAQQTYDVAVSVLDSLTVEDRARRYLESQLAIVKTRLMLAGKNFAAVTITSRLHDRPCGPLD